MRTSPKVIATAVILASGGTALAESKVVEVAEVVHACFGDVKKLCSGNIVGGDGLKACMKDNLNGLSDPCFEALMTVMTAGMTPPPDYAAMAEPMRFDKLRGLAGCRELG